MILVVERHCLYLQNAGKLISRICPMEFQPPDSPRAARALTILCLDVKPSCSPVQNLMNPQVLALQQPVTMTACLLVSEHIILSI